MFEAELELEAELEALMSVLSNSDLESEAETTGSPVHLSGQSRDIYDQARIPYLISQGLTDENKLTDAVFYDRYPAWKGKSLQYASLALRREWMHIRDAVVRPGLKQPPASQQPARPAAPPAPAPQAPATPAGRAKEPFGYSKFLNILKYRGWEYPYALGAQARYQKVSGFLPWYKKISIAAPRVSISLAPHGVGELVFSMDKGAFTDLVEDPALRNKALEIMGAGLTAELVFTEDVIGVLGLGMTLFDIARGLENERMLGSFGPEHDKWIAKQQLQFVFGLLAEDISRRNWGDGYFFSRNSRDLAVELANRFAEFRPVFYEYANYYWLEDDLGRYQGNLPEQPEPPTMGPA